LLAPDKLESVNLIPQFHSTGEGMSFGQDRTETNGFARSWAA
jgi:hypothetical protein